MSHMIPGMDKTPAGERWKPIPGFPDYEASSAGRVRRTHATRTRPAGWVLKVKPDRLGYLKVCVWRSGVPSYTQSHRLVCLAFHGLPSGKRTQVAHGNGIPSDCRAKNLRWASAAENAEDRSKHGNWHPAKGEKHHAAVLTDPVVREMRSLHSSGISMRDISRNFGTAYLTTYDAIKGNTWKHL